MSDYQDERDEKAALLKENRQLRQQLADCQRKLTRRKRKCVTLHIENQKLREELQQAKRSLQK